MTHADSTPESFFGSLISNPPSNDSDDYEMAPPDASPSSLADSYRGLPDATSAQDFDAIDAPTDQGLRRRVEDLTAQMQFLDSEIGRYRDALEAERVRHAKELLDLNHQTDRRVDEALRNSRQRADEVHDSYRSLVAERQMESEETITRLNMQHAKELHSERERHKDILSELRVRSEQTLHTTTHQVADELTETHRLEKDLLATELDQLMAAVERLQRTTVEQADTIREADKHAATEAKHSAELARRLQLIEEEHRVQYKDLERQVAAAEKRVSAERRRAAATVAEVLEHSASIAAEADTIKSDAVGYKTKADSSAADVRKQARFEYEVLAEESDERAYRASVREAELEDVISDLRAELRRYEPES